MLFRKNIEPRCLYCAHGSAISEREVICRRAAKGWRLCCAIPAEQANGFITSVDLVFEREKPEER